MCDFRGFEELFACVREHALAHAASSSPRERSNLLVRIHFIVVMIRWTGLAPWEFEFPFTGSLTSTLLGFEELFACVREHALAHAASAAPRERSRSPRPSRNYFFVYQYTW